MTSHAWLESSLQRSASLGLEVLKRASRRSVDWTSTGPSQTPTTIEEDTQFPTKRCHTELNDAFGTLAELMAQTTNQCKRFYESGCCTDPTDKERKHVSRFHTRPAAGKTPATLPTREHGQVLGTGEDYHIEVAPGTYSITASIPELQQQTQMVSVRAGESIDLTFNL
ncbi:A-kinase-interacting protein 1 [Limanda limanda]|uniref:A-kinase-interacting protein 1 n=1 Tax=Limanda limanda TaxID=27771 RepID=UPI0029C61830|nr:A-kinase-interacting protein 1 [Limanda limanda]